ncbi:HAD-IIIC family phosphatase [Terrabacter sp. GCM10028922]|uniref:HAD-IIIC family phosphatase n=1 Tax=Terrabacter sp. GCM10028922 TaxID=3273428 RepID=UPI0036DEFD91
MNERGSSVVGVTASFTPHPLVEPMLAAAPPGTEVVIADYNQVHQTLLDVTTSFDRPPDRLVVLWRIEDVFGPAITEWVVEDGDPSGLREDVRQLGTLVGQAAAAHGIPLVVSTPPVPTFVWLDPLDARSSVRLAVLHGRLVEAFVDGIGEAPVTVVDLAALVRLHGTTIAYDTRNDLMYHQPFTSRFAQALGTLVGEALSALGRPTPKVLAVDADNTLWGGIVGEDGPEGIVIGDSFPGNGYRALQQGLVYQAAHGALIALLSKNNGPDVDEVFARRAGDLVLSPEHLAARRVDWNAKVDNLREVADELNLGTDGFILLDDNDVELDEVRQRLPGVQVVKVGDEPEDVAETTAQLTSFRFARVSAEDRGRTAMMRVETGRRDAAAQAPSHEDFLRSLGLVVRVFAPGPSHVARVAQLVNKTNQFNLTTIRRDDAQVAALVASADHRVYAAEVSDRFGGYGLVAVAVVECNDDAWDVETFLMSCRVLRRGVEDAILQCVADDAVAAGATRLRGSYRPTAKNSQVSTFYPDRGFTTIAEGRFEAPLPLALVPDHVTVRRDA